MNNMIEKDTLNYWLSQCISIIKKEPSLLNNTTTKAIINDLISIMIDTKEQYEETI